MANTISSINKANPRQTREFIIRCLEAGLTCFVKSSPGLGKSAIIKSIAEEFKLELIDLRLSQCDSTDLLGLPHFENGKASWAPFTAFPIEGSSIPKDKNGWLLFLDEFNSANKSVLSAAYKLVLDRMMGQHKLHENVYIVCAGNLETDRAIVNPIGTALKSRLIHINMNIDFDSWLEDFAIPNHIDKRIIAYLNYDKEALCQFDPESEEDTYPCPRSWEFASKLIKDKELTATDTILLGGTLGSGYAVKFVEFTRYFDKLPNIKKIHTDPDKVNVPKEIGVMYATICSLAPQSTKENIENTIKYISKFEGSFQILFLRMLRQSPDKSIMTSQAVIDLTYSLSKVIIQ